MAKSILMGPILYFLPSTETEWRFRVMALVDADSQGSLDEARLTCVWADGVDTEGLGVDDIEVHVDFTHLSWGLWVGWDVSATRGVDDRELHYTLTTAQGDLTVDGVCVPGAGALPRIAFFSCNGAGEERKFHELKEPYALWADMKGYHEQGMKRPTRDDPTGIHLLLGGGDQLYADPVWEREPLAPFRRQSVAERVVFAPDQQFEDQLLWNYLDLYTDRWSRDAVACVKSRVPGIFAWDDHDIFDGWGSHDDELTASELYQAVFRAARTCYEAFQLGSGIHVRSTNSHLMQAFSLPGSDARLDVVLLDTRSERTREQVMSEAQWNDLNAWLEERAGTLAPERHLVVVTAVPVVYLQYHAEGINAPFGLEDDRRDAWEHSCHRGERSRLIMTLLAMGCATGARTTIVSGDVHVASRGRIVSRRSEHLPGGGSEAVIHQLTASAIGHPAPGWLEWAALQLVTTDDPQTLHDGVETELGSIQPGRRYLRSRNFLIVQFRKDSTVGTVDLWAQWCAEEGRVPEKAVISGYAASGGSE